MPGEGGDFKRTADGKPRYVVPGRKTLKTARRASNAAGPIMGSSFLLNRWRGERIAEGFVRHPRALLKAEAAVLTLADDPESKAARRDLRAAVDMAEVAGGGDEGADEGTVMHHHLAHHLTGGASPLGMGRCRYPERLDEVSELFDRLGWKVLHVEVKIVNEKYNLAGTCDLIVADANGLKVVADFKSGKDIWEPPVGYCAQLAGYAGGELYDVVTGERSALGLDQDVGYLIHVPLQRPQEPVRLMAMDLAQGRKLLDLAEKVRKVQESKTLGSWVDLGQLLGAAEAPAEPAPAEVAPEAPEAAADDADGGEAAEAVLLAFPGAELVPGDEAAVALSAEQQLNDERVAWLADRLKALEPKAIGVALSRFPDHIPRTALRDHREGKARLTGNDIDDLIPAFIEAEKINETPFGADDPKQKATKEQANGNG